MNNWKLLARERKYMIFLKLKLKFVILIITEAVKKAHSFYQLDFNIMHLQESRIQVSKKFDDFRQWIEMVDKHTQTQHYRHKMT